MIIRSENKKDYRVLEGIAREAFWNLYLPGCYEHLVVHNIRKHVDFIEELSFVVEVKGEVVGAIYYTKSKIIEVDDQEIDTVTFGPVFILPKYQRRGIAKEMIMHSIEKAKSLGYKAIITLGYPYHYNCYGFVGGKTYNISMIDGNYYKGLLVLPLYENALKGVQGYASFSNVFEVTQEQVDEFDKQFDQKEKLRLDCQIEYEKACVELD